MLDIGSETALTLSQAACELPKLGGRKLHASSLWRWARKGVRGVKLDYARLGGRIVTSREALSRFGAKLAEADRIEDSSPLEREAAKCQAPVTTGKPRSAKRRAEDIARA